MLAGYLAGADRVVVAFRSLQQTAALAGQISHQLGRAQRQVFVIYHIHIGSLARSQGASVSHAEQPGGVVGLLLDYQLQGKLLATSAVSCPVGERPSGHGGIADGAAVGAAV